MGKIRKVARYELYLLMSSYKLKYTGLELCSTNED